MSVPSDDKNKADGVDGVESPKGAEFAGEPLDTSRLDLDDTDERLPWLESGDEFEGDEGSDTGRIMGFVLMGLVALAAIVGGIWWATHRGDNAEMVADGSVIEAPVQPYKEAPKNPGGKTFAGTGDTSFAVSEGQSRPARLGQEGGAAQPVATASPSKVVAVPSGTASAAPAPVPSGVGVQVGAFSSQVAAEAAWGRLSTQYDALSGLKHRVIEGRADIGTVYRLQAMAGDVGAANALCGKLKSAGLACQVKH